MRITIVNLQKKIPVHPLRIKKSILNALKKEGIKKEGEITVSLINDRLIAKLNRKFLKKDMPTDVLAFDISDDKKQKAKTRWEIIISVDTAKRNCKIYKTKVADELELYSIHGILHLLGYNDHCKRENRLMRKKEAEYANS